MTTPVPALQPSTTPSRRPRWFVPLLVLVLAVAALGVGVAIGRNDATPTPNSAAQLTTVQTGCEQWASRAGADTPDGRWCGAMTSWMKSRMNGGMMGSSMFDGPDQLRDSCRQWGDENLEDAGGSASSDCDHMVTWMNGHAANGWDNMMMHGR